MGLQSLSAPANAVRSVGELLSMVVDRELIYYESDCCEYASISLLLFESARSFTEEYAYNMQLLLFDNTSIDTNTNR